MDNNYFYLNWFSIEFANSRMIAYSDTRQGPALNKEIALDVLKEGKDRIEPAFAKMVLKHQTLEFKEPGQKKPSKINDIKQLNILFGEEIPTYHVLKEYIQTKQPVKPESLGIHQYDDWRVKPAYDGEQKNCPYIITDFDWSRKIMTLQQVTLHIVVNPVTWQLIWKPKLPEVLGNQGTIESVFDEFFKPKHLSEIKANEADAFLQECPSFHTQLVRRSH
ncbi:MAG: hypothetical protein J6Y07_01970 [Alphaproteobacteria bacterium]|nr:hypothetical protein [Alphaproteobacteria bacterium]